MQEKGYARLFIIIPSFAEDAVSNRLFELGVRGLQIEDEEERITISAYFPKEQDAQSLVEKIASYFGSLSEIYGQLFFYETKIEMLVDENWAETWKQCLHPVDVENTLWITPTWINTPPPSNRKVVRIDPQMAFGTGSHETTRLVLTAIVRAAKNGELSGRNVIDLGCGSGILAIASALLGASYATGIDNDPVAVTTAIANAKLNDVASVTKFFEASVENVEGVFDLVLANIDSLTLKRFSEEIMRLASPENGIIILTGILAETANELKIIYDKLGIRWEIEDTLGEWAMLQGRRIQR